MIRILLVDDQNLVQQGIKSLLDQDLELRVIGTVDDGRTAVKEIEYLRPDIVLLDIEMPGMDGITTTKYITRLSPKTKVIILSSHEDKKYVTQALMAGAKGYLLKSSLMSDLKQAIVAVNNGYSQIDSRLLAKVFDPSNLKPKKRQRDGSKEQNSASQTPKNPKNLAESRGQLFEDKSAVQSPDLLDLELQEPDATSTSSGKYQLGNSSLDLIEPEKLDSPVRLPSKTSEPEIIEVEIAESVVSEQDTFIQERVLDEEARELEKIASNNIDLTLSNPEPTKNSKDNIAEFSGLEELLPEIEPNNLDNSVDRSSSVYDLPPISDLGLDETQEKSHRPSAHSALAGGTKTIERATPRANSLSQEYPIRLTTYKPVRKRTRSKSKLKQFLKTSLRYSWVWNVILIVFGAVIVMAIGSL